jgi:hypothetical protein
MAPRSIVFEADAEETNSKRGAGASRWVAKLHSDETNEFDVRTANPALNPGCRGWSRDVGEKTT